MKQLPDNTPVVTVNWIAERLGITPGRVRRYIEKPGQPLPPNPALKNHVLGMGEYAWMRSDAEAWMEAYRAAPKRGRRGDGSKQRKVTPRMRQIVSWMRENDGYIMCSESGDEINEIEVVSTKVDGENIISKTFGTITETTLERLCNADLVEETDHPIHNRKGGRIVETTTYYRTISNEPERQNKMISKTLIDILTGALSHDNLWGIYAEKIDGEFKPESPARFGHRQLENGGLNDDCELFANNEYAADQIDSYLGRTDGRDEETISESDQIEAGEYLIGQINEHQ